LRRTPGVKGGGRIPELNPIRHLARRIPAPLDGVAELWGALLSDIADLPNGLPGDDLDAWDPEYIERTLPLLRLSFGNYFRGEVRGLEHVPDGASLLVGNHSGGLMIADTFVLSLEFYEHFGPERRFHQLAHDGAARHPALGLIRRYGTLAASHENAKRAFAAGAPVLVYPGGDFETFRPTWHSDRIEFGGRKGFIRLALEEGVPIVPVVAIGGQESALFVTRGQRAARLTRLDRLARIKVLPVSLGPPFGVNVLDLPGRLPLPSKITVEVLPPIDVRERFGESPDHEHVYEAVTGEMQDALGNLSEERTVPLVG
jgi:1-acyl-sn-glycerol-3-phosphate acyltransferase